jgi:hypothetical protein
MAFGLALVAMAAVATAADPAAPKVSTFAPAKDVVSQIDYYLNRIEGAVQSETEYKDSGDQVARDANTVILLALAAGMHDEENKYQAAAAGLMKAAQELAKAKDFAAAKAGVEAVKKASESKGDAASLKWTKVADLDSLMKQVPTVNTRMKLYLKPTSIKKKANDAAGSAATLAVIAQGSMADTSEAKNDEQVKQWQKFCAEMRDAAAKLNKDIRAGDATAANETVKTLMKACDDCHAVFQPDQAGKAAK